MRWAYGVTTVPKRRCDLLPKTLASLCAAGFDSPRLFIDGARNGIEWEKFNLAITLRWPTIRTYGNWILGLAELYIREPEADRYAMFQDDFVTYRNLRSYLEKSPYPDKGYLNLYTFPSNQLLAPAGERERARGNWFQSRNLDSGRDYHGQRQQTGRGAVALVFNRMAVQSLITHQHMVDRPMDVTWGWRKVDGGIVEAMNKAGFREYVHDPSLTQHVGRISTMGSRPHKEAITFRGEDFDATEML